MILKSSVDLRGLQPQMALAYTIAATCYAKHGYTCTITSASDSRHGPNSLHYCGKALDIRTRDVREQARPLLRDEIKEALGPQFDVVLESDHLHVEFDPKDPPRESES